MNTRDIKDFRQDLVAIFLCICIVGIIAIRTLIPAQVLSNPFRHSSTPTLNLSDANALLQDIVTNYDNNITDTSALDPSVYESIAQDAADYGASNDLLYVAELMKKYNDTAELGILIEAANIVSDVEARLSQ